jgi:hypothetical protein
MQLCAASQCNDRTRVCNRPDRVNLAALVAPASALGGNGQQPFAIGSFIVHDGRRIVHLPLLACAAQ